METSYRGIESSLLAFRAKSVKNDGKLCLRKSVNVFQGVFDFFEKVLISFMGLPARFADIEVIYLSVQKVLVNFSIFKVELLNNFEHFEGFEVSVNTRAVDPGQAIFHKGVKFFEWNLLTFMVEDELK